MSETTLNELTVSLFNQPDLANVEFVIGQAEKIIYAHKILLSRKCKFLRGLFYSKNWKSSENQVTKVFIPDVPYEPFKLVINYMYSSKIKLDLRIVWEVLLISKRIELRQLTEYCFEYICERITFKNCFQFLNKALDLGYDMIKTASLNFIQFYLNIILDRKGILCNYDQSFLSRLPHLIPFSNYSRQQFLSRLIEWSIFLLEKEYQLDQKAKEKEKVHGRGKVKDRDTVNEKEGEQTTQNGFRRNPNLTKITIFQKLHSILTEIHPNTKFKQSLGTNCPTNEDMSNLIDFILKDYSQNSHTYFKNIANKAENGHRSKSKKKITICFKKKNHKNQKNKVLKLPKFNSSNTSFRKQNTKENIISNSTLKRNRNGNGNGNRSINTNTNTNTGTIIKSIPNPILNQTGDMITKTSPIPCLSNSKDHKICVLIISTDNIAKHIEDVKTSISSCNDKYLKMDSFDAYHHTPSLRLIYKFDVIFLYSSIEPFADSKKLGDRLAKFSDQGGGLIISSYRALVSNSKKYKKSELLGKITTESYLPIKKGLLLDERSYLDEILDSEHPLISQVSKFDGGMLSYRIQTKLIKPSQKKSNSVICRKIAIWDDGNPLIAIRERTNNSGRVIVLNFWPVCGECYGYKGKYNYWRSFSHGRRMIANSIRYASQKSKI
ncbi:btb/poz domain-containing protein [Anaeramoeba flamelloides]|uniref:Btb/poz domain-containing protein n=1 Tax=Anaeramoeba flamelloides TaxID=1746091 RepID=A0AAV8A0D5_9EUKA|nr:btb/poz domain-containing protein [Anaeramoeba flamelloides]